MGRKSEARASTHEMCLGMFVLMASPKSCADIPCDCGLMETQQEADQRGFWMSFEDRGPQHRAVTTMTSSAKGGTTLQDVV